MLRNYYINKSWIVSNTARRVYRVSACLSLLLFFVLMTVPFAAELPEALLLLLKMLLPFCVLGAAITMIAMEYFLFGFDSSPALKRMFWFGVMLFPPLGPTLYCFVVYSRHRVEQVEVSAGGSESKESYSVRDSA